MYKGEGASFAWSDDMVVRKLNRDEPKKGVIDIQFDFLNPKNKKTTFTINGIRKKALNLKDRTCSLTLPNEESTNNKKGFTYCTEPTIYSKWYPCVSFNSPKLIVSLE